MFQKMKNIDSAFRYIRGFTLLVLTGSLVLSCIVVCKSYDMVQADGRKIYVLANGKALEAWASDRKDNIPVEAKDHIQSFHRYFFTLDPDEKVITDHITRALYLADGSAKMEYDNLRESGYYTQVIAANISQRITIDSIRLNTGVTPFYFACYATEKIIRTTGIVTRSLRTEGFLRSVSRSENNPHGFLIERWAILENRDLKTEKR
jgi:conjugative transposon TraK protein